MSQPTVQLYFWQGEVLYIGTGLDSSLHRHHAFQIGISLGNPFLIRHYQDQSPIPCRGFIAPSQVWHQVYSSNIDSIFLWFEAEGSVATALMSEYSNQQVTLLSDDICQEIANKLCLPLSCSTAHDFLRYIYTQMGTPVGTIKRMDNRVQTVIEVVKSTYEPDIAVLTRTVAAQVFTSPSRLRHLFHSQIGMSIQQYILWHKLLTAISASVHGVSLTQASHEANFSDSAHFSRTFRQMFGIKPSEIFGNSHRVQVNACET